MEVRVLLWRCHPHPGGSKIRPQQDNENIHQVPFTATLVLFDYICGPRARKIISKQSSHDYLEHPPLCLPNGLFLLLIFILIQPQNTSSEPDSHHKLMSLYCRQCIYTSFTPAGELFSLKNPIGETDSS